MKKLKINDWLAGWLPDCLTAWLAGWLADWLADWLTDDWLLVSFLLHYAGLFYSKILGLLIKTM